MSEQVDQLQEAVKEAEKNAAEKPSRENLNAWHQAKRELEKALEESTEIGFKSQADAIEYLKNNGWQISAGKFSQDIHAALVSKRDGRFLPEDLDAYAESVGLTPKDIQAKVNPRDAVLGEQHRKLKMQNDIEAGRYTLTSDIEKMLATRAALLKRDNEQFWRENAMKIIRLVGGDERKAPELIEFAIDLTGDFFNTYAEKR